MNPQNRPAILLMDEDAATLEQLQTVLLREGYRVLVAADGHAALQLAKRQKIDLVISEPLLAGLDGYEVWRLLQADSNLPKVPILVISALDIPPKGTPWRPNPNAEWQLLSYDAFLPKPVDLRRFVRVVKKLLHDTGSQAIPGGPSVTIAIEDPQIQSRLAHILKEHDFEVEAPPSMDEALKLLVAMPPGVLLLDYRNLDDTVKKVVNHTKTISPGTVIILVIDPSKEVEAPLLTQCDGFLTTPLYPTNIITGINQTLEMVTMRRRTDVLSSKLMMTNRDLSDAQQALRAQNEELQHINARLRELDTLKETLTGMVAHDLRTPLSAVLGALSLLSTDPESTLSTRTESLLTSAMTAANQMVRLTETLLEGQRLEEGRLEPDQEPFDLASLVTVSLEQMSPLASSRRLKIETTITPDLPLALADPHITQRVLENLLDNAIKFSPRDGVITIAAAIDGDFIRVSITDQGPGIPKDQQSEIFEQFAQIKGREEASRSGFGLGLTFCHLATEAMGGKIWVESDGQTGSTFIFTLPIYREEAHPHP